MRTINWGVLGAANIAYTEVVPAIRRSDGGNIVAVASRNTEKAKRFNVPKLYPTYEGLLEDNQVDAVYIPLPNALHKKWAIKALEAKKHVLVEKPATISEDDMKEIVDAADRNDVIFMEAFMYQFHAQHQYVRELLESRIIGDYRFVKAHFSFFLDNQEDIRLDQELGGGAFWDVGCYGVHALTQIIGMKPTSVSMFGKIDHNHQVDTTSVCFFTDDKNRCAEISASFEGPFVDRYEIFGEKGAIIVESAFRPDVSKDGSGKVKVINLDGHEIKRESFIDDQYLNQIKHFQECILSRKLPIYNQRDSLEVVKYIENGYRSLQNDSKMIEL
ncbi:NDP-hexose-3-ketoreductase [Siminovitchia terrae]|uniref:NDP-hexose-3-ketoreductase n=1 Tax=Siminovitchia terrae TaxID=1914933 RepID=A0ABQ4L2B9_SIMTE|nr:Gfo/Idh/MocA family oxidoreductase [Siminovitchia terrae]GIN91728.1 NDP-hexose-3-ketoreductase [Siminovitchia terrae]GIN98344.1 NDP-hexose-3-ketoreductase [Siminovitchia terrae]